MFVHCELASSHILLEAFKAATANQQSASDKHCVGVKSLSHKKKNPLLLLPCTWLCVSSGLQRIYKREQHQILVLVQMAK
jgi:hypothetical protein